MEWKYRIVLPALEREHLKIMQEHNVIQAQAMEVTGNDHKTLNTILCLAVRCMLSPAQPLSQALQGPWHPPATPKQAPTWAWEEVLWCIPPAGPPVLAPAPGLLPPIWVQACRLPWIHVGMEPEVPGEAPQQNAGPAGPGLG